MAMGFGVEQGNGLPEPDMLITFACAGSSGFTLFSHSSVLGSLPYFHFLLRSCARPVKGPACIVAAGSSQILITSAVGVLYGHPPSPGTRKGRFLSCFFFFFLFAQLSRQ